MLAAALAVLIAAGAAAAAPGAALVVGIDGPPGSSSRACGQLAREVGAQLGRQGIVPQVLDNPSIIALRSGVDDFAVGIAGAAPETALAYVCAPASADGPRLFVLPSGTEARTGAALAERGVIVQAFLTAMAGTGGTVFADLALPGDAVPDEAARALAERLPAGLHLALNLSTSGEPWLGQDLASGRVAPGWDRAAAGFAAGHPPGSILLLPPAALPDATGVRLPSAEPPRPVAAEPPTPAPPPVTYPSRPTPTQPPGGDVPSAPAARPEGELAAPAAKPVRNTGPRPGKALTAPLPARTEDRPARLRPAEAEAPPLPSGPPDARTQRLQAALARQGFYRSPADGRPGAPTQKAVRQFQRSLGAAETGELTQSEIIRLLNQ